MTFKRNVAISFADDDEDFPTRGSFYVELDYIAYAENPKTEELEELGDGSLEGSYSAPLALNKIGAAINRRFPGADFAELDVQQLIPDTGELTVHFQVYLTTKDKPAPKWDQGLVKTGANMVQRLSSYFDAIKNITETRKIGDQDFMLEFDGVFTGYTKDSMARIDHIINDRFSSAWVDEVKFQVVK